MPRRLHAAVFVTVIISLAAGACGGASHPVAISFTPDCSDPWITIDDKRWVTQERLPADTKSGDVISGNFEDHGDDTATFRTDGGYEMAYFYVEFADLACGILPAAD